MKTGLTMAKLDQIRRICAIVCKLQGHNKCIPAAELVEYISRTMYERWSDTAGCTQRTLQRDFKDIEELFGITISHAKGKGYYIAQKGFTGEQYEQLMLNFELLASIDADSALKKYVFPEHRRTVSSVDMGDLLFALKETRKIEFDYMLVRHGGKIVTRRVAPHFLKESQHRWYLIAFDDSDAMMKIFGLDRIDNLQVLDEKFKRDNSIDVPALFDESFGIWNNPEDPVEEIVLKYDLLDGAFVKTLPLHHTQRVIAEDEESVTFYLKLRITNDFVMELLQRSRSLEVISPLHLRERLSNIYLAALKRNM